MIGSINGDPCVSTPQGSTETLKHTRAEALALREGYVTAMRDEGYSRSYADRVAASIYPLPKKTVLREATHDQVTYRFNNGRFEYKGGSTWIMSTWLNDKNVAELTAVLALKDNPTCEVEDTGDE